MTAPGFSERDARYLREAIALSQHGRRRGNRPFGALIVADDGEVLAQAWCDTTESGDCTGHAETNAVRRASPQHSRARLAAATLYSSAEPCVMCAGAIFWSAIGRVVYGTHHARLGRAVVPRCVCRLTAPDRDDRAGAGRRGGRGASRLLAAVSRFKRPESPPAAGPPGWSACWHGAAGRRPGRRCFRRSARCPAWCRQ